MIYFIIFSASSEVHDKQTTEQQQHENVSDITLSMPVNRVRVIVFNATFNNILVISWRSVLLVEETGLTLRKPLTFCKLLTTLSHNVVSSKPRHERDSNSQL